MVIFFTPWKGCAMSDTIISCGRSILMEKLGNTEWSELSRTDFVNQIYEMGNGKFKLRSIKSRLSTPNSPFRGVFNTDWFSENFIYEGRFQGGRGNTGVIRRKNPVQFSSVQELPMEKFSNGTTIPVLPSVSLIKEEEDVEKWVDFMTPGKQSSRKFIFSYLKDYMDYVGINPSIVTPGSRQGGCVQHARKLFGENCTIFYAEKNPIIYNAYINGKNSDSTINFLGLIRDLVDKLLDTNTRIDLINYDVMTFFSPSSEEDLTFFNNMMASTFIAVTGTAEVQGIRPYRTDGNFDWAENKRYEFNTFSDKQRAMIVDSLSNYIQVGEMKYRCNDKTQLMRTMMFQKKPRRG